MCEVWPCCPESGSSVCRHVPPSHHPVCLSHLLPLPTLPLSVMEQSKWQVAAPAHWWCPPALQAVDHYVSGMSWSKFLMNLIDPNLNDIVEKTKLKHEQALPLSLESDADWFLAIQKSLLRQR